MTIEIKKDDCLPSGMYVLWNSEKIRRAKTSLPFGANNRDFLIAYDKIGGLTTRNGVKLPPQSLWEIVKNREADSVENLSNDELYLILRKAENSDVPGSRYLKAKIEFDIRHKRKMEYLGKKDWWEKTFVQVLMVLGAIAGLIGLYLTLR